MVFILYIGELSQYPRTEGSSRLLSLYKQAEGRESLFPGADGREPRESIAIDDMGGRKFIFELKSRSGSPTPIDEQMRPSAALSATDELKDRSASLFPIDELESISHK